MTSLRVLTTDDLPAPLWDAFVEGHPQAHLLQSSGWGALKSRFGWQAQRVALADSSGQLLAGALLLFQRRAGIRLAYAPRGPLVDWSRPELVQELLRALEQEARRQGAAFLKMEPELPDTPANRALLAQYGLRPSPQSVQPRSTIVLDISGEEGEILARMKSKWRYNIRLAGRKGVTVREGRREDLAHFHRLTAETGQRDGFPVHAPAYYGAAYELLAPERAVFLFAEHQGEPLAAIVVAVMGKTAWYLWGASSNRQRNRMPNHALQWAGIRWARERGAIRYDFWGIPDAIGQLALGLQDPQEPGMPVEALPLRLDRLPRGELWGVYRFKQGFGGRVLRTVGAWDLPISRAGYGLYRAGLTALELARKAEGSQAAARLRDRLGQPSRQPGAPGPLVPRPVAQPEEWRAILDRLPEPHVLQSWEWGQVKAQTGWQAERFVLEERGTVRAAVQFLWRQPIPGLPLRVGYVPKGPVTDWGDAGLVAQVLAGVEAHARRRGCIFVKIDPDVAEEEASGQAVKALLRERGWRFSPEQIQFKNTGLTRLDVDEEALLAGMKSKWRYNVRLARRRGVTVRQGGEADLAAFYRLYAETGARDGFLIRPFRYYAEAWRTFLQAQAEPKNPAGGALLLAEHPEEKEPVAGLFLFRYGTRAWYFYGASSSRRRRDMPNYLLQWEAMAWARSQGCTVYDWWGAPTELDDPEDGLQGVWRFKQGFGAVFQPHIGAWDWPARPGLYRLYTQGMPLLLRGLRRLGQGR